MVSTILRINLIGEIFKDVHLYKFTLFILTASLLLSAFRCLVASLGLRAYDFVNFLCKYEILFDGNGI